MSGMVMDKTVGPGESQKGARLENKLRETSYEQDRDRSPQRGRKAAG